MLTDLLRLVQGIWSLVPVIVWIAILGAAGCYLIAAGLAWLWSAWREHVEREAAERAREQARLNDRLMAAHGLTSEVHWPPRQPGQHAQPWKAKRKGDVA